MTISNQEYSDELSAAMLDEQQLRLLLGNSGLSLSKLSKKLPLALFVRAVEQAPVAISITDKKANILYINEAFTKVTGYEASEILGENESKLSDKCTPRPVYYDLWHTISRKQVWQGRLINRRKQGERYLADLTIAPMLNEQGVVSHYIGMHRDVTDTYHTEQQVKNQKKLIESVLDSSPVAMVLLDAEQRIVLDNQMYKMLISELGLPEPALFFLTALVQDLPHLWEQKQNFKSHEIAYNVQRQNSRYFACSGNWFSESDTRTDNFFNPVTKDYLLLTINEVTLLRRQQEKLQLQVLQNLLAEEEHIRSIRETLLGAMHHIRQPLNQINAAIQLLAQRQEVNNQPLKDLLQQVHQSGEETLATLQRCVPEIPESAVMPVNLNQLIHEIILLHSHKLLVNSIVVDWIPNPELPSILGSENKLRMLFRQLLDNAISAINRAKNNERVIKIAMALQAEWVCISISDNGPGIPAHQRTKVFEPFFTTEQNLGCAQPGMGLVIVREIVSQHKGLVEIDPHYNPGCRIVMHFPLQG